MSKTGQRKSEANLRKAAAPVPLPKLKQKRKASVRKAATVATEAVQTMAEQLAAEERAEVQQQDQEAQLQAEAKAAALRLEVQREETLRSLAAHRLQVAAGAEAAEGARAAAAATQHQQRQESAELSRKRDLQEIEQQVKAFHAAFKQQHGRAPKRVDLDLAANVRMKVAVERYQLLKHGRVPSGLQGGRDRSRVFSHQL